MKLAQIIAVSATSIWMGSAARAAEKAPTEPVLAPLAAVKFCDQNPVECAKWPPRHAVPATPGTMATIKRVNSDVNKLIKPSVETRPDAGVDVWRIAPSVGDCNDYAVTKRHNLTARGLPPSAVVLSQVKTEAGEDHLVAVVRTDKGALVLDNLRAEVRPVSGTGYVFVKSQSSADPNVWEAGPPK